MPKKAKRVLILTYYWPPAGGSGVQRWVKFAKYLREFGWEPVIYTPSNPEFPETDPSIGSDLPDDLEVIKKPIWEPYSFYKKFVGLKPESRLKTGIVQEKKNNSLAHKLSVWIRGNFFIPDARKFWVKPSVKFLHSYLKTNPVDAIVTNGTPHSLHLIGMELSERLSIPWLADFRDPWTNIDFFNDLKLTNWASNKHHRLEQKVLESADCVTVTTPGTRNDFLKITADSNVHVITNGFDTDDFSNLSIEREPRFIVAHIGVLTPSRNHPFFWDILKEIIEEVPGFSKEFTLRLIGSVDDSIKQEIDKRNISDNVEIIDYIPHSEVVKELRKASVLLLVIRNAQNQNTIIPGKIFEYLAAKRPIISIGPRESDSADILTNTNTGNTFSAKEKNELKAAFIDLFQDFRKGVIKTISSSDIEKYSRRNLTKNMADLLSEITKKGV